MRCTLSLSLLAVLSAGLVSSAAIDLSNSLTVRELSDDEKVLEAAAAAAPSPLASPSVVKIDQQPLPPNTQFIEPPPLFDPPEPRPNPLFDTPGGAPQAESHFHEPAMPTDRKEVLLPFDGAHVHPENTPYPPEEGLPGTCTYSFHCSWMRTYVEIMSTILGVVVIAWACVCIVGMVVRGIARKASLRARSPSGSLRMEPEVKKKDEANNPLLHAWRSTEKETVKEKKVSFAV
ncbi:hypothetical protein MMC10_009570 [Thelotrema lepadinum]|nr:hypothetical protein [Thelotrema lepadinum]